MKRNATTTFRCIVQIVLAGALAVALCSFVPRRCLSNGAHDLYILSTNDIHGAYFDSSYVGAGSRPSLYSVKTAVDSVRRAVGSRNVILLDAGDYLQGDNASYYFNFVDTVSAHIYPRMASYIGYDAVCVGNHDIEATHRVYDRVRRELKKRHIPMIAANTPRDRGGNYFDSYKLVRKAGLRVLLLGYENSNMKSWVSPYTYEGFDFKDLTACVQGDVDRLSRRTAADVVVVFAHTGVGNGEGTMRESQALDVLNSVHGVDFIICAHDHSPVAISRDSVCLVDAGSHCRKLGFAHLHCDVRKGRVESSTTEAGIIDLSNVPADPEMSAQFRPDFEAVRDFTLRKIGRTDHDLRSMESFAGQCAYMNLIHTVTLERSGADVSLLAPLKFNAVIPEGDLIYNDMFAIYPYENLLAVTRLSGKQIKDYLEKAYGLWVAEYDGLHALKIVPNSRGQWTFAKKSYNFDTAGGLRYTVDITKPEGEKVRIESLADGRPFCQDSLYSVATTSYRANGMGWTPESLGMEMRSLIYEWIVEKGTVTEELTGKGSVIGEWKFVPVEFASEAIRSDMKLIVPSDKENR